MEQYLPPRKAAEFVGVSKRTLQRWEAKRILRSYRTPGDHRRYLVADLKRIAAAQGGES